MSYKDSHIFNILKHISFVLVLCVMILQPISEIFSDSSTSNYELVDIDWEDDADKEDTEENTEEGKKVRPYATNFSIVDTSFNNYIVHFYVPKSSPSRSLEILIPPPELI